MTHIGAPQQGRTNYPVIIYDPNMPVTYINNNSELWVFINREDASSFAPQNTNFLIDLASYISQNLRNAGACAFRGVVYAANFGKKLSDRAVVCVSTTLSNNEENIRSTLLTAAQMANCVAQLTAGHGRHALAALGYASMQAGETIVDSATRHGPYIGNALLDITTQAAHSATRFAADQGPVVIKAIGIFGNMSVQATGTFVAAARDYGPSVGNALLNITTQAAHSATRFAADQGPVVIKAIGIFGNMSVQATGTFVAAASDYGPKMIEMTSLARVHQSASLEGIFDAKNKTENPQSASLEVIEDAENENENLQSVKTSSEDVDPLGRLPLTRSPSPRQDTAIASQAQMLDADTKTEQSGAPHAEPTPAPKSLFKRFFTSIQDGLSTIFNGAHTVVFSIANALLSVVTFKWLRGH